MNHSGRTYLLIGHVTKDLLPDGGFLTGGTVTYAAKVAKHLGWAPVVVTAAAHDFDPPTHLTGINWHVLPSKETTTYKNKYGRHERTQVVGPIAQSIKAEDIPVGCRHAALVHFCPVAQEFETDLVNQFQDSMVVATPQGWIRRWNHEGVVSLGEWRGAEEVLSQLDAAVVSVEDIGGNWTLAEQWAEQIPILVVTQDKDGCTLFNHGGQQSFLARPSHVIDATGAGDVFAAAFFIRLYETRDPYESARFANITASMALELPGTSGVPSRMEVDKYVAGSYVGKRAKCAKPGRIVSRRN